MHRCFLGLGSNLGEPIEQIMQALRALENTPGCQLAQCSSLYGTQPVGPQDQPDFINCACLVLTKLSAVELLYVCQHIEKMQGREKKRHWGERIIDIDLLLYDNLQIDTPELIIPHPQLHERDFVLSPLLELQVNLHLPTGEALSTLLEQLPTETRTIKWQSPFTPSKNFAVNRKSSPA